ncbi:hypothetical protein LWI29_001007 [Acer saccharum]|uniref:Uncharacterized protein n=1 Tax=Acer saccharum TaxID=4024 RepID=A0AA39SNL7_ACESA|nr:hypothetical protein LWI29_001007 [Acer saccharum]
MGFSMAAVDGGGLAAKKFGGGNWRVTAGMGFSIAAVDGGGLAAEKSGDGNLGSPPVRIYVMASFVLNQLSL